MFEIPAFSLPVGLSERAGPQARISLALLAEQSSFARRLLDDWSHPSEEALAPATRCARVLLRYMLRDEVEHCRDRPILRAPDGRPVLEARIGECLPAISLTHSGGFVAAAHGFVPGMGLDLECSARDRDIRGIAELAFGAAERRQVEQSGPAAFYRIWTGREALAKATGRALAQVIDRRDYFTHVMSDDSAQLHADDKVWNVAHASPMAGVFLAVAWGERVSGP